VLALDLLLIWTTRAKRLSILYALLQVQMHPLALPLEIAVFILRMATRLPPASLQSSQVVQRPMKMNRHVNPLGHVRLQQVSPHEISALPPLADPISSLAIGPDWS